ncbi:hypothetical protein QTJ16_005076 [Diplocarpon rosae]|uniref:Transcription initiation factor TFIID subunit 8 n=1 Tax=Diplocarpon rosae TaxID=946125 RepID=A0AAD9SZE5_9HELO|nr:hypothetical protein QTJ16_005076 [Diplocarpon rosae]
MAPISPISRKRSTPSQCDDDCPEEPTTKRRRLESGLPHTPPPEEESFNMNTQEHAMFDDDPHKLMKRSVALALEHVGFSCATPEAMEAFCAEVDAYSSRLLSKVTSLMLNARRSQPTPLDFAYALAEFNLPMSSLEPHLKPPIPASKLLIVLESQSEVELPTATASTGDLLGASLSGESDKKTKPYIPSRFPSFPSKHTYKWTEKEPARETDPRRIREEAARAARQGEEALRRLTKVAKIGKEKDVKNAASRDPRSKERHEMWEKAMETLSNNKLDINLKGGTEENDRGLIVNAGRAYNRKGAATKKKSLPVLEGL